MRVDGVGQYTLLGDTIDDAAGEAFDKSAKLLGLAYPGGPLLAKLAESGDTAAFAIPRPLLHSGDLNFSFAGLKTAVANEVRRLTGTELPVRGAVSAPTAAASRPSAARGSRRERAGRDRGLSREQVAGCATTDRTQADRGGRWRGRQRAAA